MKKFFKFTAAILSATVLFGAMTVFSFSLDRQKIETKSNEGFVYSDGTKFYLDGSYFYAAGTNAYDLFTKQYGGGDGIVIDKTEIDTRMQQMEDIGMNVIRVWGFGSKDGYVFETAANSYNEGTFQVMDYVLYSAKQHNIKVIITLENYWGDYGGIDQQLSWAGLSGGSHAARRAYYTNENCKTHFKKYFEHFANRVNTFTNEAYKEDTTIFAWDMMNEARYQNDSNYSDPENTNSTVLRAWVDEMGAYMKNIDPNHMVSIGIEGHGAKYGFGGNEGNDFVTIQSSDYIDFCTAHPYPDEYWAELSPSQTVTLIQKWIDDAHDVVKKPFLITEFNVDMGLSNLQAYWEAVYETLYDNDAGGALFWCFDTRSLSHFSVQKTDKIITDYFEEYCSRIATKNVPANITTLSINKASVDKSKEVNDISVDLNYKGSDSLTAITNGNSTLTKGTDYTISGSTVILKASYLTSLANGTYTLTFNVGSVNPSLTLIVTESGNNSDNSQNSGNSNNSNNSQNSDSNSNNSNNSNNSYNSGNNSGSNLSNNSQNSNNSIPDSGEGKLGDINNDNQIDITDVVLARAWIVGNISFNNGQLYRGDVNKDGSIDISDVVLIRVIIVNG